MAKHVNNGVSFPELYKYTFCGSESGVHVCIVVDGAWSAWSIWTECSASCDYGVQTRLRTCSNPEPQHNGSPCVGNSSATRSCFTHCPGTI